MCKVYEFPKQLKLPKEEEEILILLGEAYVVALYNSLTRLAGDDPTQERMEDISYLVSQAFAEGMNLAIEKKERGF